MLALTPVQWFVVGVLGLLYVITCLRVAMLARRLGRKPVAWFFITLFFTAIPAVAVLCRRSKQPSNEPDESATTCPHCRQLISRAELNKAAAVTRCPRCGMAFDDEVRPA
ncbi:MAG: hypothetical protein SVT52_05455 [Planctomycetota bacterium]|nr:hypothetical protein [Planctomycetota bacterium]